jgi:hypothetical protein
MGYLSRKFLAWILGLGVALALLGLLVATGESIRHAETAAVVHGTAEPEQAAHPADEGTYRDPAIAAWMTP